jgi:phenylalanyl-tRNA synthetase alpha chain
MASAQTSPDGMDTTILSLLAEKESINTSDLAVQLDIDHQLIIGAVKSLHSRGDVVNAEQKQSKNWQLTPEGEEVVAKGSHEAVLFSSVDPDKGTLQAELMKSFPNAKVGFSKAMSAGWITVKKNEDGGPRVFRKVDTIVDSVQHVLQKISVGDMTDIPDEQLKEFKKRKLIDMVVVKSYTVTKGSAFSTSIDKLETDLTPEMLASGSWKEKKFKAYNFDSLGVMPSSGHLHPLMKVRTEYRQIFLEMGFTEMPTNNFVESSFWNFDALFQPQQHPARDLHDTFFVKGLLPPQS